MDIEQEILAVRSKDQVLKFVQWVGRDKRRFRQLMDFFLQRDDALAKKSAWIVGHCAERNPHLVYPWLKLIVKKMKESDAQKAVKRNIMRILQFVDIPRTLQGVVANLCFELLSSLEEPIAVRALSMTVLAKIAKEEPELKKELEVVVRQMLPYATPAFRARAKRILSSTEIENVMINPFEEWR